MESFTSSSGDLSDSQGFNAFLNGPDSSSESVPIPKAYKKSNMRPNTGDPYAYDIDFGNIKIPSKVTAKPAPKKVEKKVLKKQSSDEDESIEIRPKTTGSKFELMKNDYMKMLGNGKKRGSSDEFDSESSSLGIPKARQWGEAKKEIIDSSESSFNLKTEPFNAKINQPISLNKKLENPKEPLKNYEKKNNPPSQFLKEKPKISVSPLESDFLNTSEDDLYSKDQESSSNPYGKESEINTERSNEAIEEEKHMRKNKYIRSHSQSDEISEEENESEENYPYDSQYESHEQHTEEYTESQDLEKYTENYSEKYSEENSESKSKSKLENLSGKTPKTLEKPATIGENIFKVYDADDEPKVPEKRLYTPVVQEVKPPVPNKIRPQTSDHLYTRERELEIEVIDLRKTVVDLQSQLALKQEQIYFFEKKEKQNNFAKIEIEALDKAKTQLRECYHKIELYKIETEELIKQVDYTEGRVKDLEAENITLKQDIERKEKVTEERLKLTESRTSERTIKEYMKQYELEKEENFRLRKEMEIELTRLKSENVKTEGENRELRSKLWTLRAQEEKIKDLTQENYLLSQRISGEALENPLPKLSESAQKELEIQEQLIKGYQKENEKLMSEVRMLKAQMKEDQLRMHYENRKVDLLKSNLIKDHGGILIKENFSDLESISALAGGNVINKEDYLNLKDNVSRLTKEIMEKEKSFRERELELCGQLEKFKKFKFDAEFAMNSMQNSQEFNGIKVAEIRFENEKQRIVERFENEIEVLKSRIARFSEGNESRISQLERAEEGKKMKMLEEHCRALEEALKQKEPISTLIKAVKPESSDQVDFLIKKIADLESELKKKSSGETGKKLSKTASKPVKFQDPALLEKVKTLEKQLEETKNYYISRLNSVKPDSSEELKHLRSQVENYEKILSSLKATANPEPPNLFPFLSSLTGSTWCQICQELAFLSKHIEQKNSRELITIIEKIIETLEFAAPSLSSYQSFDRILDKTLSFSSLLKGIPNWSQIEKHYNELCSICNFELAKACNENNEEEKNELKDEEYWSDFSDCDQEQEDLENDECLKLIQQVKEGIGYLNRIGGGWLSLAQVQDLLSANIPQIDTICIRGLLRKLKTQQGKLNIDQFLQDLRNNNMTWWRQEIVNNTWEAKSQISNKGNHKVIVDSKVVPWVLENIIEKIENYVNREGIDYEMLAEQVFSGSLAISKRNFRKKVLEHKLPLTREECHIIVQELDRSKIGQITSKIFLNLIKRGPKPAWIAKSEELPEYKQLSERDASFLLLQANKKIQALESELKSGEAKQINLHTDHTLSLKLQTLQEELESIRGKFAYCLSENEKLKIDKQRLEVHISKQPTSIGTSEYLSLQRKLEAIEENHYRREQELKNRMSGISFKTEQELEEVKKKYEAEKNMLQKVILKKNEEIYEFKEELEELLNEIEALRTKRKAQH